MVDGADGSDLRVLVVHSRYRSDSPSGENDVVDDEIRLLREHGCTVELAGLQSDDISGWPVWKKAVLPGRVVWSPAGRRLVERAIGDFRPDVIHIHNTFPLLSPGVFWTARAAAAGVVHTLHNFRPLCPASTFLRDGKPCEDCLGRVPWPAVRHRCYRDSRLATAPVAAMDALHQRLRTWQRCVDRFIALTAFQRDKYVEGGWPAAKFRIKSNTVVDAPGPPRAEPGPGFLCLSRLSTEKGVDVLLEAWGQAFPAGGPPLRLAGSGDLATDLETRYGALPGVTFLGAVGRETVREELSRARALVVPSRWYEGFPRVVVEAYAAGVPVVASRLGSLAEIVEDGVTGLHVEPGDPADLAASLRRLAADDDLAASLGRQARNRYESRFSPQATMSTLLAIYREAVAAHARP